MTADALDRQRVSDKWPVAVGLRLPPSAGQSLHDSVLTLRHTVAPTDAVDVQGRTNAAEDMDVREAPFAGGPLPKRSAGRHFLWGQTLRR